MEVDIARENLAFDEGPGAANHLPKITKTYEEVVDPKAPDPNC
jgi:hypothetical protein